MPRFASSSGDSFGLLGRFNGGAELGGRFLPLPFIFRLLPVLSMTLRIQ